MEEQTVHELIVVLLTPNELTTVFFYFVDYRNRYTDLVSGATNALCAYTSGRSTRCFC
jgi:hypothetical protein